MCEENPNEKFKLSHAEIWKTIASRRQSFDAMVWQTAGFALTAQSFLYVIALNGGNSWRAQVIACVLSILCGLATISLMLKHRFHEEWDSKFLATMEKDYEKYGWKTLHTKREAENECCLKLWKKFSSVTLWVLLQLCFVVISVFLCTKIWNDHNYLQKSGGSENLVVPSVSTTF